MKSSIFLTAASAALALAGPVEKRKVVYQTVTDITVVTVTGEPPAADPTTTAAANNFFMGGGKNLHQDGPDNVDNGPKIVTNVVTVSEQPEPEPTTVAPSVVVITMTKGADPPPPAPTSEAAQPTTAEPVVQNPVSSSVPSSGNSAIDTALEAHNIHRRNHSAPALKWNAEIAQYAANTAASCHFAHDMDQGSGGYGQNIAMFARSNDPASIGEAGAVDMATTNMWYNGEFNNFLPSYYGQDTPDMSNFEAWGHLTQVIWQGTQEVGCHSQLCPAGTMADGMEAWYMVCNYMPPGNVKGAYGDNVKIPNKEQTVSVQVAP